MNSLNIVKRAPNIITLLLLISFGSVGAVLFTPAIPQITQYFHITPSSTQWLVTIYLIGVALGQLIYGPVSNRYGRKLTLYIGIVIEIVGAIFCAFSQPLHFYYLLVIARFIMALGAAVGLTLTLNIISDYYNPTSARKVLSYTSLAFSIMPALSVTVGGYLVSHFHWNSAFYFLAVYGLLVLLLTIRLPETAPLRDVNPIQIKRVRLAYYNVAKSPGLLLYALLAGCSTAIVYIFATIAPFIVIERWHISPDHFGLLNLIPLLGMFIGNFIAAKLAQSVKAGWLISIGILVMLLSAVVLFLLFYFGFTNTPTLFFLMFFLYFGLALAYANCIAQASEKSDDKPHASALISFINMGIGTVGVAMMGLISVQNELILPLAFMGISCIMLLLFVWELLVRKKPSA